MSHKFYQGTLNIPVRTRATSPEEAAKHNKMAARALARSLDRATLGTVRWNTYEEVQITTKVKDEHSSFNVRSTTSEGSA